MKKKQQTGLVSLFGALGLIVIVLGFTELYDFWYGLIAGFIIWILTGVLKKYWNIEKK